LPEALSVKVSVDLHPFQLPVRILVEAADPHVPDALSGHGKLLKLSGRNLQIVGRYFQLPTFRDERAFVSHSPIAIVFECLHVFALTAPLGEIPAPASKPQLVG
jgi:hypothetical protein